MGDGDARVGLSPPLLLSTVTISLLVMLELTGEGRSDVMDLGRRVPYRSSSAVEVLVVVVVLKPSPSGLLFTVTVSVLETKVLLSVGELSPLTAEGMSVS